MKKRLCAILAFILIFTAVLSSCSLFGECEVTYDLGGAADNIVITVDKNTTAPQITAPELKGHKFLGWYTDKNYTTAYDFSAPVTQDLTIYAKYALGDASSSNADFKELINTLTLSTVKACVMLSVEKYNLGGMFGGIKENSSTSTGSGAVFKESGGYYYIITNNHVVTTDKTYRDVNVTDYQGNKYAAEVVCEDPEYDLAVVKIAKKITEPLTVLEIAATDPAIGDEVVALGAPSGQMNAVTVGKVTKYSAIEITADSSKSHVTFPVIWHSAPIDNGSSGGVIVDTLHRIVGVNYAAATKNGDFVSGLAIPVSKLHEFLEKNGITL